MVHVTPQLLLRAYAAGVFPMAEDAATPELHWVDPEIRGVMPLDRFHIAKSLRKSLRHKSYSVKIDSAFADVIAACAERTRNRPTTWINHRLLTLYTELHRLGHAHSVECWENGQLVGGLYGVRLGAAFFGESMFSRRTDASKIALVHLVARLRTGHFTLLDAQFSNPHLEQFGVDQIPKDRYQRLLARAVEAEADFTLFNADDDPEKVLRAAGA